jgi:hypothetical protein
MVKQMHNQTVYPYTNTYTEFTPGAAAVSQPKSGALRRVCLRCPPPHGFRFRGSFPVVSSAGFRPALFEKNSPCQYDVLFP